MYEGAGVPRLDMFGTPNPAADVATVAQAAGNNTFAAGFTRASSQRLDVTNNSSIQMGDISWTIAGWVYLTSKPAAMYIAIKYSAAAGNTDFYLYYDSAPDRFKFGVARAVDSAQIVTANTFGAPSTGTWYFLRGWHDAGNDTVNISVNNGAADSQATGGALQAAGTANLSFGGNPAGFYLDGRMADWGIWKRLLSAQETAWLYNNGRGRTYPFDGRPTTDGDLGRSMGIHNLGRKVGALL